jgi:hypothetical protein
MQAADCSDKARYTSNVSSEKGDMSDWISSFASLAADFSPYSQKFFIFSQAGAEPWLIVCTWSDQGVTGSPLYCERHGRKRQ